MKVAGCCRPGVLSANLASIIISMWHITSPRQFSFDFQLQRQAEECADENDQAQDQHILHRGRDNNRANDVASNKKLEPEQNRAPDVLPVKRIVIAGVLNAMNDKSRSRHERTTNNDKYTYAINGGADDVHNVPIGFHGHVSWRNGQ